MIKLISARDRVAHVAVDDVGRIPADFIARSSINQATMSQGSASDSLRLLSCCFVPSKMLLVLRIK